MSVAGTWRLRFTGSPMEWILIAAAFLMFLFYRKPAMRPALPFLIYGGCMILLVARVNTDDARYLSPFLPALQVFAGAVLALQLSRFTAVLRSVLIAGVILILAWDSHRQFRANPILPAPADYAALASLRAQDLRGKTILVPSAWVPMVHYYIPGVRVRGYAAVDTARKDDADGVLYASPEVRYEPR